MKLKQIQETTEKVEEIIEEKKLSKPSKDKVALLGIDADSDEDVERELRIIKKTNPALYHKIVNLD